MKNKPIFISNWTKSGILYIKDLFNDQGQFRSEQSIMNDLITKHNWIQEYMTVKRALKPHLTKFNFSLAKAINIKTTWNITRNNNIFCIKFQRSSFYYKILTKIKAVPNYMQKTWERTFELDNICWEKIYRNQVWGIKEKKIGEFNYKLICNILNTRTNISKWNREINGKCQFCKENQTVKHLLFDCPRIQNLWSLIGNLLKMNISYKHLILGDIVANEFIEERNLVITYVKYGIYKHWIMAENKMLDFNTNILHFIKKDLFRRTLYVKSIHFLRMCDTIVANL